MAGYSIYPSIDLVVEGKYGKYRVRKEIGKGGNGAVFAVDVTEGGEELPDRSCNG